MTDFASQNVDVSTNPVARFFNWIWKGLVYVAENNSRARALRQLSEISDADLAARGVTRQEVVRRMFAGQLFM